MKHLFLKTFRRFVAAVTLATSMLLTSCGGGGSDSSSSDFEKVITCLIFPLACPVVFSQKSAVIPAERSYIVGGTVSGLSGSGLILQNNGSDGIAVGSDGAFTFPRPLLDNGDYAVIVETNPVAPTQTCTVSNGTGTIAGADVTNVLVTCATNS